MKFAMIDGNRHEAAPGLSGTCPIYGHPMIARCGEIRMWHWAHQGSRSCDPWWESETEWHREWKGRFPKEWQEIIHHSETGEKHIADVKTGRGWIIEFQHSRISPEERRSRDSFYGRLIWVVNGLRRKKDAEQFRDAWNVGMPIVQNATIRRVLPERCALLREWSGCASHVFIDFGGQSNLWWLFSKGPDKPTYIACFSRPEFLGIHRGAARSAPILSPGEPLLERKRVPIKRTCPIDSEWSSPEFRSQGINKKEGHFWPSP